VDLLLQQRERLDDPPLAGPYYFWLGYAHSWLGHRTEAAQSLGRSLAEATRAGDRAVMGRVHRALTVECTYSGRSMDEAVAHGREAVALLESTDDRFWLGQALYALCYSHYYAGNLDAVIEVAARLDAFGEATGSRRARANAGMIAGISHATLGNHEAGVKACERALELAPDPFETAAVLTCLGKAHVEAGDAARALPLLEQAVDLGERVRSRQWREWFRTLLGEGYFLSGQLGKAHDAARQALDVSTDLGYALGIGWAHQVLGRVALARGGLVEAEKHLGDALEVFAAVHSRFESGRTRLFLAACAHARGDQAAAAAHVDAAHTVFQAVPAPMYVARAETLAAELGIGPPT
jgi:tetratricopeptide (TPR) repeat protein